MSRFKQEAREHLCNKITIGKTLNVDTKIGFSASRRAEISAKMALNLNHIISKMFLL
jgi:hypothetical protein